jgi:hypothetical protein
MTTHEMTHPAAQLAALAPRELDALAHEVVFGDKPTSSSIGFIALVDGRSAILPDYSADLNAAALLEQELARREIMTKYNMNLCAVVGFDIALRADDYCPTIQGGAYYDPVNPAWLTPIICASAKDRTIATILAVQDSPYLSIVTWDRHPRDLPNSQSANDSAQGAQGSSKLRPSPLVGTLHIGEVLPSLTIARMIIRNSLLSYGTYLMPPPVAEETIWNAWALSVGDPLTDEQIAKFKADYSFAFLPPSPVNDDDMKSILAALDKVVNDAGWEPRTHGGSNLSALGGSIRYDAIDNTD